jgi:hypothetical protein
MFQFPPLAPAAYGFSSGSFRDPGLNARLTAPPGLSQSSTPFIACRRQDIPHTPLVAWPRRPCPRFHGNREGTATYRPFRAGVTIPSLIQGSCRESQETKPKRHAALTQSCDMQLLPLPELSKNNTWLRDRQSPKGFPASLHWPGVDAPQRMPRPATSE